jgi:hypothetical protein
MMAEWLWGRPREAGVCASLHACALPGDPMYASSPCLPVPVAQVRQPQTIARGASAC